LNKKSNTCGILSKPSSGRNSATFQMQADKGEISEVSYEPKTISMDANTFQKTMIDIPEYKFSNLDIDEFYSYI
jgi:hypothetical protein